MSEWVAVVAEEGDEPIEVPTEADGTLLLTSITAQFPGTIGLKFRNPATNAMRGCRSSENVLFPPSESGWGSDVVYICNRPDVASSRAAADAAQLKRKSDYDFEMSSKNQRVEDGQSCDLIVLGLPFAASEADIRTFFEKFGELMFCQLKMQPGSNKSKGYAFIRFADKEVQDKVCLTRHMIDGRWCDVKVPDSQENMQQQAQASCKIFVGRITEDLTADDLKEHFETFGPADRKSVV